MKPISIAVVFHSNMGHTARLAQAVADGASAVSGTQVTLIPVAEAARFHDLLDQADAIIFGAPTYMGSLSAEMKQFMDATSKRVYLPQAWADKLAAGFSNSGAWGGDKLLSLMQLVTFAAQHSMLWVSLGLKAGHNRSGGSSEDLNRTGLWLGAGAQSDIDAGPDVAPPESDLRTGAHLGRRVAELAHRFRQPQQDIAS